MNILLLISRFLAKATAPFVILIAAFTYFYPPLFLWVKGDIQTLTLGVIMLTMGMTLSPDDFKILAQRPLDIFIGAAAQYTIMPLLAFGITHALHLSPAIAAGLILVGCCPGGVSSNIMTYLAKGDVAFSVGMTTASTLLSPIMTPMLVFYLAKSSIHVDAIGMFRSILLVTILPVTLGAFANFFWGKKESYQRICGIMPGIASIGLACIVGGVMAYHGDKFFTTGLVIFLAIALHNFLGYLLGYRVGRLTRMNTAKCRTISIEVGVQNAGLATSLATKHFAALPEAALASAVSCVWHSISGTILAGLFLVFDQYKEHRAAQKK